jgi:hypothetical protein
MALADVPPFTAFWLQHLVKHTPRPGAPPAVSDNSKFGNNIDYRGDYHAKLEEHMSTGAFRWYKLHFDGVEIQITKPLQERQPYARHNRPDVSMSSKIRQGYS